MESTIQSQSQISDDEDNKSDVSIVTNSTMQTLDVFPVLHKFKTEREDAPTLTEGLCSPIIPVLSTAFLMKSLKRASQSSVEDEDSDGSHVSESIISTQSQRNKERSKTMDYTSFQSGATRTVFNKEINPENLDRKCSPSELDQRQNHVTLPPTNQNVEEEVTDSQETYMPDEQNKMKDEKTNSNLKDRSLKPAIDTSNKTWKLPKLAITNGNQTINSPKVAIMNANKIGNCTMSYEMRAFTNSVNNNKKLDSLIGNNNKIDKDTLHIETVLAKGRKSKFQNNFQYHTLISKSSEAMVSTKSTLHCFPVCNSDSCLPHLTEKDISMICKDESSDKGGENIASQNSSLSDETQPLVERRNFKTIILSSEKELKEKNIWEITPDNHCTKDINFALVHDPWTANPSITSTKGNESHVLSLDEGETTLHSSKSKTSGATLSSTASSKKSYNDSILNEDGLIDFSQETLPPTNDVSMKTNSAKQQILENHNNEDDTRIATSFDGSQSLFQDTQSSISGTLPSASQVQELGIIGNTSHLQDETSLTNDQIVRNKYKNEISHSNAENCRFPNKIKSPLRLGRCNTSQSSLQAKGCVPMEVSIDVTPTCQTRITDHTSVDMDVCSEVEPSQMLLMPTQDTNERAKPDNVLSSQPSSMSSLGDISDSDFNYKTKEQQILNKVERMQVKIQKKLTTASQKTLTCDIEILKQQIQAIKGILVKIAERHKLERNKLSLEVKRSSKSKTEKSEIRENLIELSERQKILFKLFQRHKEISRIIREDVKLNECLASALLNEEVKTGPRKSIKEKPKHVVKSNGKGNVNVGKSLPTVTGKCRNTPKAKKVPLFGEKTKQGTCTTTVSRDEPGHLPARHNTVNPKQTESISKITNLHETNGQEKSRNLAISLNGTQELFCTMDDETSSDSYRDKVLPTGHNLTSAKSSVTKSAGHPVGIKSLTNTNHSIGIKAVPPCEEDMLKAMGLFTSTKVVDDAKRNQDTANFVKLNNTRTSSNIESEQCKTISNERSNAIIVDKDPVVISNSNASVSDLAKVLSHKSQTVMNAKESRQTAVEKTSSSSSKPLQTNSKSPRVSLLPAVSRTNAAYLSVPMTTNGTSLVKSPLPVSYNTEINGKQFQNQFKTSTVSSSNDTGKNMPGRINSTKIYKPPSQERKKKPGKPTIPNTQKSIINLDADSDEEIDPHSQQEVLKRVMEDAMRIINDRSVGNLKRPQTGIDNVWQSKQSKICTEEPLMPINPDIFKSPPLYKTGGGPRDISPSVASFTTFRSAFPDHSPEICNQPPYQCEDVGIFEGLKYPPLSMLIEKQILRPRKNVLSVFARDKEFKASLTDDGCIESMGGELFQTPVKWLAAILGKPVPDVKKSKAYKEVNYRGKPLMSFVEDPIPLSDDDQNSEEVSSEKVERTNESSKSSQNSMQKLKTLLNNCKIKLLDDKDLVSDNDLPENFWTDDFSKVRLSYEMWKEVDNWE